MNDHINKPVYSDKRYDTLLHWLDGTDQAAGKHAADDTPATSVAIYRRWHRR